jgi:hypothetical protein
VSGQGQLILVQRFKGPSAECDRRTYRDYVRRVLAHETTMDEVQDLCRLFVCGVDEIETKIVNHLFGKKR